MEEEETLAFVETEEDKMSYRELLHMIDQIEIGHQQHMWKEEVDRRQDSQMPPDPLPSRFSDWSSLDSPRTRTSPHSSPDVRTEQQENTKDPTNVPSAVETRQERDRISSQEGVPVAPQVEQQREEWNVFLNRHSS